MKIFVQDPGDAITEPASLDGVKLSECKLLWVDIDDPSDATTRLKGADFEIELPAFDRDGRASGTPHIRERASDMLVTWSIPHGFDKESHKLVADPVIFVVGDKFLVTMHDNLREIADVRDDFSGGDYEHPLYSILDTTAMADIRMSVTVTDELSALMDTVLGIKKNRQRHRKQQDISEVKRLKGRIFVIRRLVTAHRNVLLKLTRRGTRFISESLSRDLMDVLDQLWGVDDAMENDSDMLATTLDIQLNVTMKRLTTIATTFMPLTFLVGVWGMNFRHMPELAWRYGYLGAWLLFGVITVAMVLVAYRKGWY